MLLPLAMLFLSLGTVLSEMDSETNKLKVPLELNGF